MGVKNSIVTNYDGWKIPQGLGRFNWVLLDAPCSGLGVISKDKQIKQNKTIKDIKRCSHLQKELLRKAVDLTKPNGIIVYSTCSISPEENESVIDYILSKWNVKLLKIDIDIESKCRLRYKN